MTPEHKQKLKEGRENALKLGRNPAPILTEDQKIKLLEMVKKGYTITTCRNLCGISEYQFSRWLKNKENLREFSEAESTFLALVQEKLIKSATDSIDGARYLLERRLEDFNLKTRMEFEEKKPLRVVIKRYSPNVKKAK